MRWVDNLARRVNRQERASPTQARSPPVRLPAQIPPRQPEIPSAPTRAMLRFLQATRQQSRSEEHTSELQSRGHLVCRLLLEKKKLNPVILLIANNLQSRFR